MTTATHPSAHPWAAAHRALLTVLAVVAVVTVAMVATIAVVLIRGTATAGPSVAPAPVPAESPTGDVRCAGAPKGLVC